jgi:putative salt-induced outer membrane protein YdiY
LKAKIILFSLLVLALEIKAQQVINIESKQYDSRDSGWHGNIDFSFNLIQNTNQVISTGNKINLMQVQALNTVLFVNEFNFVRANSENLDYNSYQHLRFKRYIKPFLSGEAFAQTQFNQQIGLKFRGLLGAGPRIRLFYADSMKIFVGPMWMYEYEQTTDESLKNVKNRLSLYFSFLYFKEKHFNFDFVSYYQPDLIDFSDFRLSSELKAEWLITKKLSFKFSFSQTYNSHPPANNPNNILNIRNSFSYRF